MTQDTLSFGKDRHLILQGLCASIDNIKTVVTAPFVVMFPAYSDEEQGVAEDIVGTLVDAGCLEFCCVGQQAEKLHDAIDWIIEDKNALSVVTTWHEDITEACAYFLFAAGSTPKCLVAFVAEHSDVVDPLRRLTEA